MYTSPLTTIKAKRRAVILLVVLAMLTLFAIVGITFVLMSDTRATEARLFREAQTLPASTGTGGGGSTRGGSTVPDLQLAFFLNRLIYDDSDDQYGVYDAIRGWSLARGMYGYNATGSSFVPYNGVGRLHNTVSFIDPSTGNPISYDTYNMVNNQWFPTSGDGLGVRDPEHLNTRTSASAPYLNGDFVGQNLGVTYPDQNNLALGSMRADGAIAMRSFFRDYVFATNGFGTAGATKSALDQNNPNWSNTVGKYLINRPRPWDMGLNFPYPADNGGDVKNVEGPGFYDPISGTYCNDSMWMNLNYPVLQNSSGQLYQPLFAPFVMDLDQYINLNSHGNIRNQAGAVPAHASNHGMAASEVNLGQVLSNYTNASEWTNLLAGQTGIAGRYGSGGPTVPNPVGATPSNAAGTSNTPHFYANLDADGGQNTQPANPIVTAPATAVNLPGAASFATILAAQTNAVGPFFGFPAFPANTYLSGSLLERTNHPVLFNYFGPNAPNSTFPASEMEAILRYNQPNVPSSRILQLLPNTLGTDPSDPNSVVDTGLRRHQITTHSLDVDRPGMFPWIISNQTASNGDFSLVYNPAGGPPYPNGLYPNGFDPIGGQVKFPSTTALQQGGGMEFGATDNRHRDAFWGRVDINRTVPAYPGLDVNGAIPVANYPAYQLALQARQQLASDIFQRLRSVATGQSTADVYPAQGTQEYEATRWLAQLAVNIVDFVNNDDYSTPFNWDTNNTTSPTGVNDSTKVGGWVFGTKMPRVALNEAYAEFVNVQGQTGTMPVNQYNVNLWVELQNPGATDSTYPDGYNGNVLLQSTDPNTGNAVPIYKIEVTQKNQQLWNPTNVRGNWDSDGATPQLLAEVAAFAPNTAGGAANAACTNSLLIQPDNGAYTGTNGSNTGFYILGPTSPGATGTALPFPSGTISDPRAMPQTTFAHPQMTYTFNVTGGNNPSSQPLSFLLRRLACPGLPNNEDPTNTNTPYNPYVTIDYIENVAINDGSTNYTTNMPNTAPNLRYSMGKMEPYAAGPLGILQTQLTTPYPDRPQHTLFQQNSMADPSSPTPAPANDTLTQPFHWLSQLHRTVVSPMELTQVSAFKPHLLTQQFVTYTANGANPPTPTPYQHTGPWFDPAARIYRFLEFVEGQDRMGGSVRSGRYSGKININTLRDLPTFRALCDAQPSNYFYVPPVALSAAVAAGQNSLTLPAFADTNKLMNWNVLTGDPIILNVQGQADYEIVYVQTASLSGTTWTITTANPVQNAHVAGEPVTLDVVGRFYYRLLQQRDGYALGNANPGSPSLLAAGNPVQSFSVGNIPSLDTQYAAGNGIQNTLLAPANAGLGALSPRLFELPEAPHPYYRNDLLTKIFDRVTTRSNVFAVWVTVGYFQVTNANTNPPQLGAEMTDAMGNVTRHKMFAIIDRSALTYSAATPSTPGNAPVYWMGRNTSTTSLVPTTLEVDFLTGTYEGQTWDLQQQGLPLILDVGPNQEVVTVSSWTQASGTGAGYQKPTITIQGAAKQHSVYVPFSYADRALGNPGPQPLSFDPRTVGGVVKYFRLIN